MKDSEFIELLNLYLDHEISAADAARLEAEVQSNPERRHVYQQYCRIQKACTLLTTDFQPVPGEKVAAEKKVVSFTDAVATAAAARRHRAGNFYAAGAFAAAAACVAIIFVGRTRQADAAAEAATLAVSTPEQVQVAPATIMAAANPATAASSVEERPALVAVAPANPPRPLGSTRAATLVADPLLLTGSAQADAALVAAMEQAEAQFAWMRRVQLPPIQSASGLTELRFEAKPNSLRPEGRTLGNRAPQANVELAAFQFVK